MYADIVHQQGDNDLVDAAIGLEIGGNQRPQRAAQRARGRSQNKVQAADRSVQLVTDLVERAPTP